jgi:alkanesulfonate monooxygenase SsuD/methylene tetrahydromethanopterin reductase-like flavin-dependent oxidoreductase (luciferase family)
MPKPLRPGGPPVVVAVSSANSPTVRIAAQRGWGPISSALAPQAVIASHWDSYSAACAAQGRVARGDDWRIASYVLVAGSDAEARERVFASDSSYRYTFSYLYEVLRRSNRFTHLKPRPDMRDEDVTVDAIIEGRVIYGSPETVASRLIDVRNKVGPFGTLLVTGVDWGGRNAAWGRESMRRLAEEVMPVVRQPTAARAAE